MRVAISIIAGVGLTLAGCGPKAAEKKAANEQAIANAAVANGFVPPVTNDTAPPKELSAYIGKLPTQQVDGVDFFNRTQVHEAISDSTPDPALRHLVGTPQEQATPIFADGSRVAAWGCETDRCAAHNWTVYVDAKNGAGEVCYHDAAKMGERSQWYVENRPRYRPGACPSQAGQG